MASANEKSEQYIGETKGAANNVHDLVHDLGSRLDAVWRYDQYMANAKADGNKEEKKLWSELQKSEMKTVKKLKSLLHKALGSEMKK